MPSPEPTTLMGKENANWLEAIKVHPKEQGHCDAQHIQGMGKSRSQGEKQKMLGKGRMG